ncbi:multiheme c-type cytochrome [Singulisphaera sp. PoT]|uniref:multiheme c-type cytochrome n=1 Tax=Singulisphaera sp. PoT TaxID=3411797 RepID=UPI003BF50953
MSGNARPMKDRRGRVYKPAVGPRLRPLLWTILGGFALLGANGVYLASVTALTWWQGTTQQTPFYMLMVFLHLMLGFAIITPFLIFGFAHLVTSWKRPNKEAINYGLVLLACTLVILVSGLILVRFDAFEVRDPQVRSVGYWLHVSAPLLAVALYVKHRLAGPRIRWEWARRLGGVVSAFVVIMAVLHSQDPRSFGTKGPREGKRYFFPSEAVTANGKFIPAETMMMDDYCLKCHQDAYKGWFHSAHHFSSFNNKAYLSSVRETRQVSLKRDGNTQGARWCAGCHDPVPFFSGEFDDPNYDDVSTKSSQAGITCTVCHSITNVNSTRGNADYTIEEPQHYPFASSDNPLLQWVNNTLVKAKPEMHKKTFLKPVIKDSKFCSTCHKVGIPFALNHYKDFLRGQNHYDTFLLSGVSGHGARSFYYPPEAKGQCVNCHMNFVASTDFGARDFDGKGGREIHNHLFLGANTGLPTFLGNKEVVEAHAKFLKDAKVRVDLFALREGGGIDGAFLGPLRPEVPSLKPKHDYLVEVVVRTLGLGHPFSQGTVDSNEIWVELIARADGKVIGRSGGIGEDGTVDPYSHFINVYMLDRDGHRIDRRNPQDIFVPLYNKQIPPGAGQVVHFGLKVDERVKGPITLEAKVNYRKFDRKYMDYIFGKAKGPELPVVVMASDSVQLPVEGGSPVQNTPSPIKDAWQRWNDYGIGLFLEGADKGGQKGELKQAEPIFQKVAELGKADGWVNLARVYLREGRIPDALGALEKAAKHKQPAAPWVINWLTGQINDRNGLLDDAIASYESVLATKIPERAFDFSLDYEVLNVLGTASYSRARIEPIQSPARKDFLSKTIQAYRRTIAIDSENVAAHYGLGLAYGDPAWSAGKPQDKPKPTVGEGPTVDEILALSDSLGDPATPIAKANSQAWQLTALVGKLQAEPPPTFGSRLDPLHKVVERLGPAWDRATDPGLRYALTKSLEASHKALHKMLKPDETAEGRAVSIARRESQAADQNAQSIVIHSLHRDGAPGVDEALKTARSPDVLRKEAEE